MSDAIIQLPFKRSHAFIIGINDYVHITPLKTAVNDAKGIAQRLEAQHGYDIHRLFLNPTKDELEKLFFETMPNEVGEEDRVIVYFAGHGIALDSEGDPRGYIVPVDAKQGDRETLVSMDDLHTVLKHLPCKHGLLILDCCFSGAFRWSAGYRDLVFDLPKVIYQERFYRYARDEAWQVITSSAYDQKAVDVISNQSIGMRDTEAGDHSPFALALFEAIEGKADVIPAGKGDGVITASELFAFLRDKVETETLAHAKRQSPSMFSLPKHKNGEYIFISPGCEPRLEKTPLENPFMGLASYGKDKSNFFFGRDRVIKELVEMVENEEPKHQLIVVSGASGTGKSSVIKAGLLPELEKKDWKLLKVIRPGKEPMQVLKEEIGQLASQLSEGQNTLLIVDQYEELITQCLKPADREAFEKQLANWLNSHKNLYIILSVRSDFEPQFDSHTLKDWWQPGRYIVPAFTIEEIREVITKPAIQASLVYKPESLVSTLVEEVSHAPGALPLLSFTLSELYQGYISRGAGEERDLSKEDYTHLGGVVGSLRSKADKLYSDLAKLGKNYQSAMRILMKRMVSREGGEIAGRRVMQEELFFADPDQTKRIQTVANKLIEARLVVRGTDGQGRGFLEPAHDALVRAWARLWEWIKEEGEEKLILQQKLYHAVQDYQASKAKEKKEEKKLLWDSDPRLNLVNSQSKRISYHLNAREEGFVKASVRKRMRKRITVAGIALLVCAGFGLLLQFAYQKIQVADELSQTLDHRTIESNANELAAEARSTSTTDPAIALNLAYAAYKTNPSKKPAAALKDIWPFKTQAYFQKYSHSSWLRAIDFSEDGNSMATGANDELAKIWDVESGRELHSFAHANPVTAVELAPDGKQLITGSFAGYVAIWDIASGKRIDSWSIGSRTSISDLAFSIDKKTLLIASKRGEIIWWDLDEQAEIKRESFSTDLSYDAIAFSPDQTAIITSQYGIVKVRDLASKEALLELKTKDMKGNIYSVATSEDGHQILTGAEDHSIRIWDAQTGTEIQRFDTHTKIQYAVAFRPNSQHIAIGSDSEVRLLDLSLKPEITGYGPDNFNITSAAFSPGGAWILAGTRWRGATIWETNTGKSIQTFEADQEELQVAFFPDSTSILIGSEEGMMKVWDVKTGRNLRTYYSDDEDAITAIAISPDGRYAVSGIESYDSLYTLLLWDMQDTSVSTPIHRFLGHQEGVNALAFSADGRYLLSGSDDSTIILWDVETKKIIRRFRGHKAGVYSVAFSPDSTKILTSAWDRTAKIWDRETGDILTNFEEHQGYVSSAAFSPDGKWVLTGSDDQTAKLWEAQTGIVIREFVGHLGKINAVAFSPDGKRALIGSEMPFNGGSTHNLRLWDASMEWDSRIYQLSDSLHDQYGIRVSY